MPPNHLNLALDCSPCGSKPTSNSPRRALSLRSQRLSLASPKSATSSAFDFDSPLPSPYEDLISPTTATKAISTAISQTFTNARPRTMTIGQATLAMTNGTPKAVEPSPKHTKATPKTNPRWLAPSFDDTPPLPTPSKRYTMESPKTSIPTSKAEIVPPRPNRRKIHQRQPLAPLKVDSPIIVNSSIDDDTSFHRLLARLNGEDSAKLLDFWSMMKSLDDEANLSFGQIRAEVVAVKRSIGELKVNDNRC